MTVSKIVIKSVCHGGAQVKYKNKYYSTNIFIQAKPKNQMTFLVRDIVNLIVNFNYIYKKLENLLNDKFSRFIFWGEFSSVRHK